MQRKGMLHRHRLAAIAATLLAAAGAAAASDNSAWDRKYAGDAPRVPVVRPLAADAATQRPPRKPPAAEAPTPRLPIDAVRADPEVRVTDFRGLQPTEADVAALLAKAPRGGYIVTFDLEFTPEGLLEPAAAAAQRAAIRTLQDTVAGAVEASGGKVRRRFETVPMLSIEAGGSALWALARVPAVARIQPNAEYAPALDVSVPLIGALDVQERGRRGTGWTVAVIDTGIDRTHPFLRGFVDEACFTSTASCPNGTDTQTGAGAAAACTFHANCSHGSHVAGIAAGERFAGSDPQGVAYAAAVMPIRAADRNALTGKPIFFSDAVIAALEYVYSRRLARQIGAVNLSLSGGGHTSACDTDPAKPIIDQLRAAGIATVAGSGNEGYRNKTGAPGCISSVVTVGATSDADVIADFTNMAPMVDLMAPGVNIVSSVPGGSFSPLSGTSMAAAHVAGAFALMQSTSQLAVNLAEVTLKQTGLPIADTRSSGTLTRPRIRTLSATGLDYQQLVDGIGLSRRLPSPVVHNFRADTPNAYWYVVAVQPTPGLDVDLVLYQDGTTAQLASSSMGGDAIDFVAVDRNWSWVNPVYPRVQFYSGPADGRYIIELSDPAIQLEQGSEYIELGVGDVVRVWDLHVVEGVPINVRAAPLGGTVDVALFAMESHSPGEDSWAQGRAEAIASSDTQFFGPETITFTPTRTGFAGIVLVRKFHSGPVWMYADETPPEGSVTIDGGAAITADREVTLTLAAADPQTGLYSARIAMDGVLDTEVIEEYFETSVTRLLPDYFGMHTVRVEYTNHAGQAVQYTDTIQRNSAVPTLSIADARIVEGDIGLPRSVRVTLTLSEPAAINTQVRVQTSDGTATAGSDYTATDAEFRIRRDSTTGTVLIPVLPDTVPEANERFNVTIVSNSLGAVVGDGTAAVVIRNDD